MLSFAELFVAVLIVGWPVSMVVLDLMSGADPQPRRRNRWLVGVWILAVVFISILMGIGLVLAIMAVDGGMAYAYGLYRRNRAQRVRPHSPS